MNRDISLRSLYGAYLRVDPRIPIAFVLMTYVILGLTVLGIHKNLWEILITTCGCVALELFCSKVFRGKIVFPLSIFITSLSLSFLLMFEDNRFMVLVPIFFAVASKYLLTVDDKHFFNPAGVAVNLSIFATYGAITIAPASQWNASPLMPLLVACLGLVFVVPKVQRNWLIATYLLSFIFFAWVRSIREADIISSEILIWGTLSSTSFLIFLFFMITDPATSPKTRNLQIFAGFAIALIDFFLHSFHNYFTFFLSLFIFASARFAYVHLNLLHKEGLQAYWQNRFIKSRYYYRILFFLTIYLMGFVIYSQWIRPRPKISNLTWGLEKISPLYSGLNDHQNGKIEERLDPRVKSVAKFLLNGESASVADVDGDGLQDLFLTNSLKSDEERCALYRNIGGHKFRRVDTPEIKVICDYPEKYGHITNAIFVDFDNSGTQSLLLITLGGHPHLFKNLKGTTGKIQFTDISEKVGLTEAHVTSVGATFADFNKDGLLDLVIANIFETHFNYLQPPVPFNYFKLPSPQYEGDKRMLEFMPNDPFLWTTNGGGKTLLLQDQKNRFIVQDRNIWNINEPHWGYVVGVADLNDDGWPDIYAPRDFGPDDIYLNLEGRKFKNLSDGKSSFNRQGINNGMNQSIADFDRNGSWGIYVSQVHHHFQAEGSALWYFTPSKGSFIPEVLDRAPEKGIKNENRIGWGAAAVDLSNEGWPGIVQGNGTFDNRWDKKNGECIDYYYFMEKLARAPKQYFKQVNFWPDTDGACMFPFEKNRFYLNRGPQAQPQFIDIADELGVTEATQSAGVASVDLTNIGRRDILITHPRSEPSLYRNFAKAGDANAWIGIDLESLHPRCNREAIGTKVTLTVKGGEQGDFSISQEKQMIGGFSAQSDKRLHFGLGKGPKSISVKINWCYGVKIEEFHNLDPNRYHNFQLK